MTKLICFSTIAVLVLACSAVVFAASGAPPGGWDVAPLLSALFDPDVSALPTSWLIVGVVIAALASGAASAQQMHLRFPAPQTGEPPASWSA